MAKKKGSRSGVPSTPHLSPSGVASSPKPPGPSGPSGPPAPPAPPALPAPPGPAEPLSPAETAEIQEDDEIDGEDEEEGEREGEAEEAVAGDLPLRWVYGSDPNDRANFGFMKLVPVDKNDLAVPIPILPKFATHSRAPVVDLTIHVPQQAPKSSKVMPTKPRESSLPITPESVLSPPYSARYDSGSQNPGLLSYRRGSSSNPTTSYHQLSHRQSPRQQSSPYLTPREDTSW
jgi:hypothetical protein